MCPAAWYSKCQCNSHKDWPSTHNRFGNRLLSCEGQWVERVFWLRLTLHEQDFTNCNLPILYKYSSNREAMKRMGTPALNFPDRLLTDCNMVQFTTTATTKTLPDAPPVVCRTFWRACLPAVFPPLQIDSRSQRPPVQRQPDEPHCLYA